MGRRTREQRERDNEEQSRRGFLVTTGFFLASGAAGLLGSWWHNGKQEASIKTVQTSPVQPESLEQIYLASKKDPLLRQGFLDMIHPQVPYASSVVYDPVGEQFERYLCALEQARGFTSTRRQNPGVCAEVPTAIQLMGRNEKHPLFVRGTMFDNTITTYGAAVFSLDDVLSILVDHESVHLEDVYHGYVIGDTRIDHSTFRDLYPSEFLRHLQEARAYYRQLKGMSARPGMTAAARLNMHDIAVAHFAHVKAYAQQSDDRIVAEFAAKQVSLWPDVHMQHDPLVQKVDVDFTWLDECKDHRIR